MPPLDVAVDRRTRSFERRTRASPACQRDADMAEGAVVAAGSAAGVLGLSAEEAALVEMRVALSRAVRERRTAAGLTQAALARAPESSPSRVARWKRAIRVYRSASSSECYPSAARRGREPPRCRPGTRS